MAASRHLFTLRQIRRIVPFMFSMMLVQANERRSSVGKPREDGSLPSVDFAIPAFGYKNHVSIDRGVGLIRNWMTTHAAAHDGARLENAP